MLTTNRVQHPSSSCPPSPLDVMEDDYIEAAAAYRAELRGDGNLAPTFYAFLAAMSRLKADPEFSGYLPKTYFSGGDLDPVGCRPE